MHDIYLIKKRRDMSMENIKKRVIRCAICFVILLPVLPYILMLTNPMRRPEPMATNYVLRLTPIGTDMEEVIRLVENHRNWRIWWINYDMGFSHPRPNTITPPPQERPFIVGEQSIKVDAGRIWPTSTPVMGYFMEMMVAIFWAFDEDGRLIDVYVRRSWN